MADGPMSAPEAGIRFVRFDDTPTFEPRGHDGVLNHALVSTRWHDTPQVSVWWGRFDEGGHADLHVHEAETQVYVVLSGSFVVGDGEADQTLGPRDTAIVPAGRPHRIAVVGNSGEVMVITTPGLR
jgi:mannose-6-phosphate isomerase-like protein (cupin superfamily)